jgi:hypothetical protein
MFDQTFCSVAVTTDSLLMETSNDMLTKLHFLLSILFTQNVQF